jgi:hypothetical protein
MEESMISISPINYKKLTNLPEKPDTLSKDAKIPRVIFMTNEMAEKAYLMEGLYIKNDEWIPLPRRIDFGPQQFYEIPFDKWLDAYKIKLL